MSRSAARLKHLIVLVLIAAAVGLIILHWPRRAAVPSPIALAPVGPGLAATVATQGPCDVQSKAMHGRQPLRR